MDDSVPEKLALNCLDDEQAHSEVDRDLDEESSDWHSIPFDDDQDVNAR